MDLKNELVTANRVDVKTINHRQHLSETGERILEDGFGRMHDYLRLSLTERCNLRCFYCMPEKGIPLREKSEFMRTEEILELAGIFKNLGVKKVRLTGGEPLIRKDAEEIILGLSKLNLELGVTTNGIMVDQFIPVFKKAGLRNVNVSLDSMDKEKQVLISRRDYFDRIMRNIDLLHDHDFNLKVNMVVMAGVNDHELTDFVEFTRFRNIHIRFIEFMPFSGNKWEWSRGIGLSEMLKRISMTYGSEMIRKLPEKANDTARLYALDGYKGTFGIIGSVSNPFCSTCNRIRITADGKMKNCLFSEGETDLLSAMRKGNDIVPLILDSVKNKKAVRAGMNTIADLSNESRISKNRSMVSIGG